MTKPIESAQAQPPRGDAGAPRSDDLPAYEPPRIVKKRAVSRVTLFTGGGASGSPIGVTASG